MSILHKLPTWATLAMMALAFAGVISGAEIMFDIQDFEPGCSKLVP